MAQLGPLAGGVSFDIRIFAQQGREIGIAPHRPSPRPLWRVAELERLMGKWALWVGTNALPSCKFSQVSRKSSATNGDERPRCGMNVDDRTQSAAISQTVWTASGACGGKVVKVQILSSAPPSVPTV
jgi:hypothetical protein